MEKVRKSLILTEGQWQVLDELAEQTSSVVQHYRYKGKSSWRRLFERIADRELTVNQKQEVSSLLASIKKLEE